MQKVRRLPEWLKMQRASGENYSRVKRIVELNNLHTICTSGNCPNIGECWNAGTATFMILGDICTRACRFCATRTGKPLPPDPEEPARLAASIKSLGLKHCVITSVDRDDLPDRGSSYWAETVRMIKHENPGITIETLIPDFDGEEDYLLRVIDSKPDIISHNIETVRRLTPLIRSKAKYDTSLKVLKYLSGNGVRTKSGLMLGLGETEAEVIETIKDLREAGCSILTVGQYLQPTLNHMEPVSFVSPDIFAEYRKLAFAAGFRYVECHPLVRSSFHSEKQMGLEEK
jgi:lipoic acid synthetase